MELGNGLSGQALPRLCQSTLTDQMGSGKEKCPMDPYVKILFMLGYCPREVYYDRSANLKNSRDTRINPNWRDPSSFLSLFG